MPAAPPCGPRLVRILWSAAYIFSTSAGLDVSKYIVNPTASFANSVSMSEKNQQAHEGIEKRIGGCAAAYSGCESYTQPSASAGPATGKAAASGSANVLDVSRVTSVSSDRNPQAGVMERECLPGRPRESIIFIYAEPVRSLQVGVITVTGN